MSVYKKLSQARVALQKQEIKKSGQNKFAGYSYMQLEDFLPAVQEIFDERNLCGVVSFTDVTATLTIVDTENPADRIEITSPMSTAALKGCHEVQNLGAVQSYIRRYLWVTAMEIVEHDALDATTGAAEPEKPKPKPKAEPKLETVKGKDAAWQITISENEPGGFSGALKECTDILLTVCESAENVNAIFQTNRALYDKLKEENKVIYDEILEAFKTRKASFH
jgi:hypothetical protein